MKKLSSYMNAYEENILLLEQCWMEVGNDSEK